ncbi:uncharacterized protein BP01DRAFT_363382 [Aspergillus saccharolyticus JOP 1030-1]|uniref:Uncharacterized protein n=1 Tax=Aspergillus saccharolyticus JOP 1030-1 TaxID=1450539 RepID=A0A319AP01_9EURO|nr:hypothetical protein BP01DRAFT_363382 [Aspergillus saccharolyticus JOP 1030-1]PYH48212.1 hypothetical protein BP01DRAFT_363382 [Aspergillus saccharolyticus JOP 1030-1]
MDKDLDATSHPTGDRGPVRDLGLSPQTVQQQPSSKYQRNITNLYHITRIDNRRMAIHLIVVVVVVSSADFYNNNNNNNNNKPLKFTAYSVVDHPAGSCNDAEEEPPRAQKKQGFRTIGFISQKHRETPPTRPELNTFRSLEYKSDQSFAHW